MKTFQCIFPALAVALMVLSIQSNAQIPGAAGQVPVTSPCSAAMLQSFNPCIGYLAQNGTGSPTAGCCGSLRALMSNGTDCLCQIVTGGVPFRIPINRTLAISLPKACKQTGVSGVPVQCKASAGAPVPAPGPAAFTPSAAPAADVVPGPSGSTIPASSTPALGPVSDSTPTTPEATVPSTSSTGGAGGSTLNPSAAVPSLGLSPSLLLVPVAIMLVNLF